MSYLKRLWKRLLLIGFGLLTISISLDLLLINLLAGKSEDPLLITTIYPLPLPKPINPTALKVMTLNIAHGRRNGRHQYFLDLPIIYTNLNDIVTLVQSNSPDLIAFQEADKNSFWNGNFSHPQYIAQQTEFPYLIQGSHVQGGNLDYGTALLSHYLPQDSLSVMFGVTPPMLTKGFKTTVDIPPFGKIDIIAIHLDPVLPSTRYKQVDILIQHLTPVERPLIIMGDFNTEWGTVLQHLSNFLNLRAYQPTSRQLKTFPLLNLRLDWILISQDLAFQRYNILPATVSDHKGIIAEIVLASP